MNVSNASRQPSAAPVTGPSLNPPPSPGPKPQVDDLQIALSGVFSAVRKAVREDPALRASLVRLLGLANPAKPTAPAAKPTPVPPKPVQPAPAVLRGPRLVRQDEPDDLDAERHEEAARLPRRDFGERFDGQTVAARCRIKARAARWQWQRDELERDAVKAGDESILSAGRALEDCYLWMCNAAQCRTRQREELDRIALAYEAVANAADLIGDVEFRADDADEPDAAKVQLLAEAQSMLHVMAARVRGGGGHDPDQLAAFVAARELAGRVGKFIRFLALDDRAIRTTPTTCLTASRRCVTKPTPATRPTVR